MKHVLLGTNIYIDWLNTGAHEQWLKGGELVRHLSAVVLMELQAGATTPRAERAVALIGREHARVGRTVHPSRDAWARAGAVLRRLHAAGRETRRASLVNDVLIALNAREIGARLASARERIATFDRLAKTRLWTEPELTQYITDSYAVSSSTPIAALLSVAELRYAAREFDESLRLIALARGALTKKRASAALDDLERLVARRGEPAPVTR